MRHTFRYDEEHNVIYPKFAGHSSAGEYKARICQANALAPQDRLNVLASTREMADTIRDSVTRKAMAQQGKVMEASRIAVSGDVSWVMRVATRLFVAITGKIKQTRFFKIEKEALA